MLLQNHHINSDSIVRSNHDQMLYITPMPGQYIRVHQINVDNESVITIATEESYNERLIKSLL